MSDFSCLGKSKTNKMKYRFLLAGMALFIFIISCEKKLAEVKAKPSVSAMANSLYTSAGFISFSRNFITDFARQADYFRSAGFNSRQNELAGKLKLAGDDDAALASVFNSYGVSIDEVVARKNKVDNDLLGFINENKVLLSYSESEVWDIIREGINLGWQSNLPEWQQIRTATIRMSSNQVGMNTIGASGYQANQLDASKVWECLKDAIGIGSASILGIAGLQKLAQEGIQTAVITVSKWLAKRAGWIGAVIVVLDFSSCVYSQAVD